MYIERKEELSVYYFIEGLFTDATYIKIVDAFPEELLTIPTVAVEGGPLMTRLFEIGNSDRVRSRQWIIDIFAKNKTQRDEIGYRIMNAIKPGIPTYNYDEGFPPAVTPSALGHLEVLKIDYKPIRIIPELVETLYHRATLLFVAQNTTV